MRPAMYNTRIIVASYETPVREIYQVPQDWSISDILIKWNELYYNDTVQTHIKKELLDIDITRPTTIEEDLSGNYADLFNNNNRY